jgi:hypothetical protein
MKSGNKSGGLKHLLLAHCEKAIALVVIGLAGLLVYMSLGVVGESRLPTQLQQTAQRTKSDYDVVTWDQVTTDSELKQEVLISYDMGDGEMETIPLDTYATSTDGFAPPVVPPTVDRPDPELLPAEELQGSAVTGIFAFINDEIQKSRMLEEARKEAEREKQMRDAQNAESASGNPLAGGRAGLGGLEEDPTNGGKRRPIGQSMMTREAGVVPQGDELLSALSCAVVLAKAPSVKQFEVYEDALEEAAGYNPARDVPQYVGYFVERAEVVDGKQGPWSKVPLTDGQGLSATTFPYVSGTNLDKVTRDWASSQEDLADPAYNDWSLTTPLPPLVGSGWGSEVIHSDVPLLSESEEKAESEAKEVEEKLQQGPANGDDFDVDNGMGGMGGMAGGEGRRMGGPGMGGMRGGMPGMGGMRGGMPGMGGMRGGMPGMGGGGGGGGISRSGGPSEFDLDIPHKMVRFFDFTVKPGKQYRYRVRLVLSDVNRPMSATYAAGVDRRYLAREALERIEADKKPYRLAEWSEPSPVISVPMAGSVSIVDAKPPKKGSSAEGSVNVLIQSYALDADGRAQQAGIKESIRRGSVMNLVEDAEVITPDRQFIEKAPDFKFYTGIMLADFRGGEELARSLKRPVQALYMDAGGRLFVRHELDDAQTVEDYEATFEAEDESAGGMMMPGMPGMRGMPRGPMGGAMGRER